MQLTSFIHQNNDKHICTYLSSYRPTIDYSKKYRGYARVVRDQIFPSFGKSVKNSLYARETGNTRICQNRKITAMK